MNEKDLIDLGLTKYEAKAYLTLLSEGKLIAMHLSQKSGIPNGRMYDTLNKLIEKGLIKKTTNIKKITKEVETKITKLKEELKDYGLTLRVRRKKVFRVFYQALPLNHFIDKKIKKLEKKIDKFKQMKNTF